MAENEPDEKAFRMKTDESTTWGIAIAATNASEPLFMLSPPVATDKAQRQYRVRLGP